LIDNRAGGVVSGGARAIGPATGAFSSIFNVTVLNAGTINGDVSLASSGSGSSTQNRFFAERGGVLNGNLALGAATRSLRNWSVLGPASLPGSRAP
jgi:hypothetical protein